MDGLPIHQWMEPVDLRPWAALACIIELGLPSAVLVEGHRAVGATPEVIRAGGSVIAWLTAVPEPVRDAYLAWLQNLLTQRGSGAFQR